MELRALTANDIFPVLNIINKIGLEELKNVFDSEKLSKIIESSRNKDENEMMASVGASVVFNLAQIIIKNLPSCKDDIYNLFSDLTGQTVEEISNMGLIDFTKMLIAFFKKDEFKDFIKVASEFIK